MLTPEQQEKIKKCFDSVYRAAVDRGESLAEAAQYVALDVLGSAKPFPEVMEFLVEYRLANAQRDLEEIRKATTSTASPATDPQMGAATATNAPATLTTETRPPVAPAPKLEQPEQPKTEPAPKIETEQKHETEKSAAGPPQAQFTPADSPEKSEQKLVPDFETIARAAIGRGETHVVPIVIGGKNPAVAWKNDPDYNIDMYSTPEMNQISDKWIQGLLNRKFKNFNAAVIARPDNVLFIDDDKHAEFVAAYEKWSGEKYPSTYATSARENRWQIHFRQTDKTRALGNIKQTYEAHPIAVSLGLDFSVRQSNEYVVAEGSIYKDGVNVYRRMGQFPIIPMPDKLVEFIAYVTGTNISTTTGTATNTDGEREKVLIPHKQIHPFMVEIAGKLRAAGASPEEIETTLLRRVHEECQPPIDDAKVRQTAKSFGNYPAGNSFVYVGSAPSDEPKLKPGHRNVDDQRSHADDCPCVACGPAAVAEALWNNPKPDPTARLIEVQKFELDFLPVSIRPRVADVAKRTSTPLDFAGIASIVSLAGVTGRRVFVYPRGKDKEWRVAIALSGFIVAASGETKTPVWDAFLAPITENDAQWRESFLNAKKLYEEQMDEWESQRKKRPKAGEQLESKPKPKEPPRQRSSIINNATPEALHSAMENNPEGYFYYRDELSGFIEELDQEGRESQRDIFMKAMDGNSAYALERIGRGYVSAIMCASMGGNFQPNRLAALLNNTRNIEDGYVPRNTLMVYPERIRKVVVDCPTDVNAKQLFRYIVRELVAMHFGKVEMHFTPEAQTVFDAWLEKHTERTDNETSDWIKSHMSKYNGAVPKLAGLFQLVDIIAGEGAACEYADEGPRRKQAADDALVKTHDRHLIDLDHLNQALRLLAYLETHMRKIYGTVASPLAKAEAALVAHIKDGSLESGVTVRDILRKGWRGLKDESFVEEAIQTLEDAGWIRPTTVKTGGRTRKAWEINPMVR